MILLPALLAVGILATACREKVVTKDFKTIPDGQSAAYALAKGTYQLELTASAPVSVEWLGGSCPAGTDTKQLNQICELTQDGQVILKNRTILGQGAPATVTVKITKLVR